MDDNAFEKQLDSEIAKIRAEITSLRTRKRHLARSVLSSRSTSAIVNSTRQNPDRDAVLKSLKDQATRNLYGLQQMCAGCTAFRVQDPDPNAFDHGKVLGTRIDVDVKGKFIEPYYLFLNRDTRFAGLTLYKHTIPVHIPLDNLVSKHLPQDRPQRLPKLVKELRQELAAWHQRVSTLNDLRLDFGLPTFEKPTRDEETMSENESIDEHAAQGKTGIKDIRSLDIPVREVQISWHNGSVARLRIGKAGNVEKAVVRSAPDRDGHQNKRHIERAINSGDGKLRGLAARLKTSEDVA